MSKKLVILFIAICMLLCLPACGTTKTDSYANNTPTESKPDSTQSSDESTQIESESDTETSTERLSDSCDKIIFDALDLDNDDYYQLVANQQEDYNSVKTQVGVIKNNEWLVPLTSDIPFVEEDGTFLGLYAKSIYKMSRDQFHYIGNGCITYECYYQNHLVYNAETQKYYFNQEYGTNFTLPKEHKLSADDPLLITKFANYGESATVEILDTNTMESKRVDVQYPSDFGIDGKSVHAISEGRFAIVTENNSYGKIAFYDITGRMIFSSRCIFDKYYTPEFVNEKCVFKVLNDADTVFITTIDTEGKVIYSVEK